MRVGGHPETISSRLGEKGGYLQVRFIKYTLLSKKTKRGRGIRGKTIADFEAA
jgi:hypothetical protein